MIGLASSYGKDVIPRIAGKYGIQPISDIIEIIVIFIFIEYRIIKHL